jgi:hypothetical protein
MQSEIAGLQIAPWKSNDASPATRQTLKQPKRETFLRIHKSNSGNREISEIVAVRCSQLMSAAFFLLRLAGTAAE